MHAVAPPRPKDSRKNYIWKRQKMMLRILVAGIGTSAALTAAAQSVTMYGVIDTGLEYVNNVGAAKNSAVRMPNITGSVPSRWGIRGTEDLAPDYKAIFALESGFTADAGSANQGGRLFGRQALVGLSGPWGQLTFGRQTTMLFWAILDTDPLGPNVYGNGSLDNYLPNARTDNAIAYKGTFGGFTIGGTYSFGRDTVNAGPSPAGTNCPGEVPGNAKVCREWSAMLMYQQPGWGTSVAYDSQRGGPGAFGGLTSGSLKDDRLAVGGYVLMPNYKLGLTWIHRNNEAIPTPRSDLVSAGISYDLTSAFNLTGQASWLKYRNSGNKAILYAARATYSFTKRTAIYGTAGFIGNSGQLNLAVGANSPVTPPVAGGNQLGAMVGIKHIF